ncbi:MAG: hypothetical protein KF708_23550 [Pirellulales bacterium]|nr:hypothetical protein [Pirellulales bacterium]
MRIVTSLASCCLVLTVGTAAAQAPAKPAAKPAPQPAATQADTIRCDKQIAYCLLLDHWKEIEVARALASQLQSAEVKQFAGQLVDDHSEALDTLRAIAGEARRNPTAAPTTTPAPGTPSAKTPTQPQPVVQHNLPFLQLKQHLTDQYVQSITQELAAKNPADIDHSFMEYQVFGHTALVDELIVMKSYASPALQPVLDRAVQTSRQHLDRAKKILHSIGNRETTTAATGGGNG